MKQYDNLWVQTGNGEVVPHDARTINGKFFRPEKDKIVVTIKDLEDLWEAARKRFWWEECSGSAFKDKPEPDFDNYLTSKGITIP